MKNAGSFARTILASLIGGALTLGGYLIFVDKKEYQSFDTNQKTLFARYYDKDTSGAVVPEGLNFIYASNIVRPTVVHVKTTYEPTGGSQKENNPHQNDPLFKFFFEEPGRGEDPRFAPFGPRMSSGSGVIISADGYIVTNNHVIENASKIEVVLDDKRKYEAKLIGRDPETDLALLKIDEKGLPFAKYGNSDKSRVGEWVLACGNPFDLTSTITAGIISAKARNINLLKQANNAYAIESFIQTDAAVNPGNSGGALVNLKGELIGINTAIASNTGAYAGYSFAVPVTLVKKVMDDLLNHGEVQRGLLGVVINDVTAELAKEKGIKDIKGVYVNTVNEGSAAKDADIKSGDVILKVDEVDVNSASELQEAIAQHRPGEKVKLTIIRENKVMVKTATLKNKKGSFAFMKAAPAQISEDLGAEFEDVSSEEMSKLKIENGVKIKKINNGKLKDAGIKSGFIIQKIDKQPIKDAKQIAEVLAEKTGGILIEGVYPNGEKAYYAIGW
ncbi:MAG: Do family serine endopeptidase [Bacteroidota bacterium]|nr:Do family serine endopeptidase [Bacteroidota bacterium]